MGRIQLERQQSGNGRSKRGKLSPITEQLLAEVGYQGPGDGMDSNENTVGFKFCSIGDQTINALHTVDLYRSLYSSGTQWILGETNFSKREFMILSYSHIIFSGPYPRH